MNRIIKLMVALVMAASGFLVAGSMSGAQAATTAHESSAVSTSAPTAAKAAKPARSISLKFTRASRTSFKAKAGISPNFRKRVAILQFKKKASGTFHKIRKDRTTVGGVANFGKVHKLGYYRVITKEDASYAKSGSNIIRVYRA